MLKVTPTGAMSDATLIEIVGGMSWTKTEATYYHTQLGLIDIDCRDACTLGPNTKVLPYVLCDKERTMQISTFIVWLMFKGDFCRYPSKFFC